MRKIVSIHFPKAAGASLRSQWEQIFGDKLLLDYDHAPGSGREAIIGQFPNDKLVIHGHFNARRYASEDAYRVTFLRHPVSNLISIYFFWSAVPPLDALHQRFLDERPSIVDFARWPAFRTLMSEAYFGNYDMRRFDFIGFHETREADVARLATELNLPLSPAVKTNVTPPSTARRQVEENAFTISAVTDLLASDIKFYDTLRKIWSRSSPG